MARLLREALPPSAALAQVAAMRPSGRRVRMRAMFQAPSLAAVRRLADARSFERGEIYFTDGRVGRVVVGADDVRAAVDGTHRYRVMLRCSDAGELEYSCDCPLGLEGAFCKHCVAVCLAWQAEPERPQASRPVGRDGLRRYLSAQPHEALVGLLLDAAGRDERLNERLLMAAATGGERAQRMATFRTSIDRAVATRGFVSYADMWDYAAGIGEAIDGLDGLQAEGHAADVVELCEHALAAVEAAMQEVDDSNGHMSDVLGRVQELHLKACRRAKPEARALAQRLLEWELNGEWDTFSGAAETYSRVLGKAGRTRYRELAEQVWAGVPELAPGDQRGYDTRRYSMTRIMESLAHDIDELVEVMARDMSSGYQFLRIAEALHAAGRHDDALTWASNGLDAFPDRPDGRLVDFLADAHARRGEHGEATRLCWDAYARRPCLDTYAKLAERARPAGEWAQRREQALELLSARIRRPAGKPTERQWPMAPPRDSSELVRIHLWEDDTDAAWGQANQGGCSPDLWLELAARHRDRHPEDALEVYRARVEPAIELRDKRGYEQAAGYLGEVRTLLTRLDRQEEYSALVADLRERHGRKRNLVKLLDAM